MSASVLMLDGKQQGSRLEVTGEAQKEVLAMQAEQPVSGGGSWGRRMVLGVTLTPHCVRVRHK